MLKRSLSIMVYISIIIGSIAGFFVVETAAGTGVTVGEPSLMTSNASPEEDFAFDASTGTITKYNGSGEAVVIPDAIAGSTVKSIGEEAFRQCGSLTSVVIPGSVISIGNESFYNCWNLASVTIPDSVTSIGERAFAFCNSLTVITIPGSIVSIGDYAFSGCENLTDINISDGVINIGKLAFEDCSSLTAITIPGSVTSIGKMAFFNCNSLQEINVANVNNDFSSSAGVLFNKLKTELIKYPAGKTGSEYIIPDSVTNIHEQAFTNCSNLISVTIPNSVTSLGSWAFKNCANMASVVIPDSITEISDSAFAQCRKMTSVTIPNSVTSIGGAAFSSCNSLTSITIPNSVTSIGYGAFEYCENLTSVTIPNSVANINGKMFYLCTKLSSVIIPDSVTSIGDYAFNGCESLTEVTIPNSVTSIDNYAFTYCTSLTSITIPNSVTSIGYDAFMGCANLTIYGKTGSYAETYATANGITFEATSINEAPLATDVTISGTLKVGFTLTGNYSYTDIDGDPEGDSQYKWYRFDDQTGTNKEVIAGATSVNYTLTAADQSKYISFAVIPVAVTGETPGAAVESNPVGPIQLRTSAVPVIITQPQSETVEEDSSVTFTVVATSTDGGTLTYQWQKDGVDIPGAIAADYTITSAAKADEGSYTVTVTNTVSGGEQASITSDAAVLTVNIRYSREEYFDFVASTGTIRKYIGSETKVVIPPIIGTTEVKAIGPAAFEYKNRITSVTLPNTITSIGEEAFVGCTSLANITIPDSVTDIGARAFLVCSSLSDITIPDSVINIGEGAFSGCSGLTDITIPLSVTSIGEGAFSGTGLTGITIPVSVTSIGERAFNACNNLEEINVDPANIAYSSIQGVLCNKTQTQLIKYPVKKSQTQYNIPDTVISISDLAFAYCTSLTSLTIPSSVTSIGEGAFWQCDNLTSITIPGGVTKIDRDTFAGCKSLTSVTIPESVTDIRFQAFASCKSLASITIPGGVTSLGGYVFANCTSLTEVTIPYGVAKINEYAFENCESLDSITIPYSVTSIERRAFINCTSLTSITIPASVTSIGEKAFAGCDALTIYGEDNSYAKTYALNNSIPFSISELPTSALPIITEQPKSEAVTDGNSVNLTVVAASADGGTLTYQWQKDGVDIPGATATFYTIDSAAESDEGSYVVLVTNMVPGNIPATVASDVAVLTVNSEDDFEFNSSTGTITKYQGSGRAVVIPGTIRGSVVKTIGSEAFYTCYSLTSVTMPSSVTSIDFGAFQHCRSLTKINIPDNLTSIGDYAFQDCAKLTTINIPEGMTSIGDYAFDACTSLTSLTIPSSVTSIGVSAFRGCSSMQEINVDEANRNYSSTQGVFFNKSQSELLCFPGGNSQTTYTIPKGVKTIAPSAFSNCGNLTSVTIPSSVTNLGASAFYGCSSLISVNIPGSVTLLDSSVFAYCTSLTSIIIPGSVTSLGHMAFIGCTNLTDITISSSVTYIQKNAFNECTNLIIYGKPGSYAETYATANGITFVGSLANEAPLATNVTISGSAAVDSNLIGSYTYTDPDGDLEGDSQYRWYRSDDASGTNKEAITGATDISYTLTARDQGKYISFAVTPKAVTGVSPGTEGESDEVGPIKPRPAAIPNILTQPVPQAVTVGSSVTFTVVAASTDGGTLTYQWQKDGVEIPGAAAASHTITSAAKADEGSYAVMVTNIVPGNDPSTAVSIRAELMVIAAYSNAADFEFDTSTGTITLYKGSGGAVYIPPTIAGKEVKSIGANAFQNKRTLTSVTIPDGVISIGEYAFKECTNLERIIIPSSVISINDHALSSCYNLIDINIPDGVINIGKSMFYGCESLTNVTIPASVIEIGSFPFHLCNCLQEINVAENNASYASAQGVLFNKSKTELIKYPEAKTATEYTIPNSVILIHAYAFYQCFNLTDITLSDNLTSIGEQAFYECKNLTKIIMPDSVTSLGKKAFSDCRGLTNVTISNNLTTLDEFVFYYCTSLASVTMPASVTSIEKAAFYNCRTLTNIILPNSVNSIAENAFGACRNLVGITIPGSVTSIDETAFSNRSANLIIYGKTGSYAQTYATANGITFEITSINETPLATDVIISGTISVGSTLTGSYTYTDFDGDPEGESQYKWYRFDDEIGTNKEAITGATSVNYTLTAGDQGKYISFAVIPAAATGETPGAAVESDPVGPIQPQTSAVPIITTQPQSETVEEDSSVTFTVVAMLTDGGTLTYQWQKDGVDIPGATAANYTITNAAKADEGNYTVIVTNIVSESEQLSITSDAAVLVVQEYIDECFIATAAFGSKFNKPVTLLREFRDKALLTNGIGKAFVRYYYEISPPIAKFIAGSNSLKTAVRVLLIPVIAIAYLILNPYLALLVFALVGFAWFFRRKRKYAIFQND